MTKKPEQIYSELLIEAKKHTVKVSPELKKELHKKLCQLSDKKQNTFNKFFKPLLAVAASFIIVSAICFVLFKEESGKIEKRLIHESTVASSKPVTIKLIYDSLDNLENVKFSLALDEGISFYSSNPEIKNTRNHKWKGELKKGVNTIPFVVETNKTGKMKIIAKAESGAFSHIQEIILDAKESEIKISMFIVNPVGR